MLLITGASGHSGKWLLDRLEQEGWKGPIRCVLRPESNTDHLNRKALYIEKVVGDLKDAEFVNRAFTDVDQVIHIAGIQMSENIVSAARLNHVKQLILVHTTGRFSQYKSASADYIRIEDEIIAWRDGQDEIEITIVRPTMIYGSQMDANMHKLIAYLDHHKFFPMFGKGANLMQPVHARDLGNAFYDILDHWETTQNKEYDLSGKAPIAYRDIIQTTGRLLGRKNVIISFPIRFSIFAARVYNAVFGRRAIISVEQVMRMQEDKAFSHEAATRDFEFAPICFEDGIREEIEEYKALKQK